MSARELATSRFRARFGQSDAGVPAAGGGAASLPLSPRHALRLAAVCGTFGLLAWGFYLWAFHGDPGQDWMVFYTAARAYFDGALPLIFDGESLTAALNQRFAGWLTFTLNLHPWVYPPTFLLLFLPFGLLPPQASLAVFLATGFIALLATALLYVGRGQPRCIVAFSLLLCPAVPFNVMTGQNAFFTSALLVGGFGLLGRSPVLAGALLGLLSFKPQLWLMVPIALLAARQWRALGSATAAALLLALLSLVVFGPDIWRAWLALITGTDLAYSAWLTNGRLNGVSVFACVTWLGAPQAVASLMQVVAVTAAASIVYAVFRRPASGQLQLAALLAATMLAAPHASASDAVLLALATSLFVTAAPREALRPPLLALAAAVWISPLFNPPSLFRAGCATPVLILFLLIAILAVIRDARGDVGASVAIRRTLGL
jgi:alpha-1,2-mannosyltransferase